MSAPGEDRRTRSQTSAEFATQAGMMSPTAFSTPANPPAPFVGQADFQELERRRVDREDRRAEEELQIRRGENERREEDCQADREQRQLLLETIRGQLPGGKPPAPATPRQKFNEATNDIAAYLDMFEAVAMARRWAPAQWTLYLRGSLSGAGLMAISSLSAGQQDDYRMVKETLLAAYQVSAEKRRRRVFDNHFN